MTEANSRHTELAQGSLPEFEMSVFHPTENSSPETGALAVSLSLVVYLLECQEHSRTRISGFPQVPSSGS